MFIALVLAIAVGATGLYFYNQSQKPKNVNLQDVSEIKDLVGKIGKLMELPSDETPSVATVSESIKLRSQPFFAKADNGDKVLIYQKAQKAILYRPSENKIIEVALYNPQTPNSTAAEPTKGPATPSTPTPSPKQVKVVVYNGTKTAGLAKSVGSSLESKFPNITINSTANASSDFTRNLVVDLSGENIALAQSIAAALIGEVGSLPSSETKPDADILVILGAK